MTVNCTVGMCFVEDQGKNDITVVEYSPLVRDILMNKRRELLFLTDSNYLEWDIFLNSRVATKNEKERLMKIRQERV